MDYKELQERLNWVKCPYRLTPARLQALNILTEQQYLVMITQSIIGPLARIFGIEAADQFERDLKTFGLYEAILYFHSYPAFPEEETLIEDACALYHRIAAEYMANHLKILNSDDPNIQNQLALLREQGDSPHNLQGVPQPAIKPSTPPQHPMRPPDDENYERRLPIHHDTISFLDGMGSRAFDESKPKNVADEIVEHLDARFMFEGFPGIDPVFFEIATFCQRFGVDPFDSTGQWVIQTMCEHMEGEYFGDFNRWTECGLCGGELMPLIMLENINLTLALGGWICPDCIERQALKIT